jgi:glycerophosphoryl diester phosphodiesterase
MSRAALLFPLAAWTLAAPPGPDAARQATAVVEVIGYQGSCKDRPGNTLTGIRRAIEAGAHAAEVDVRTTRDGVLVCLHDADLSITTDGKGLVGDRTLADVRKLDAGGKFGKEFIGEPVPTLREVLALAKGRIAVMIDLKEEGEAYASRVVAEVKAHGEPARVLLGVCSAEQARLFRRLLPPARQIGLVPTPDDIGPFAQAGVEVIRLWPKWLADATLVPRVRKLGKQLHLGTGGGSREEVLPLLAHGPESLSSDDPTRLVKTLAELAAGKN